MNEIVSALLDLVGLVAGLAALWIALGRGFRRWGRPQDGPIRRVNLTGLDVAVALFLTLAGILVLGTIGRHYGLVTEKGELAAWVGPLRTAEFQLLGQGLTQLTVVAYLISRMGWRTDRLREGGLLPRRPRHELAVGMLGYPVVQALVMLALQAGVAVAILLHRPPPPMVAHESLRQMQAAGWSLATMLFVVSALLAAPLEEVIFRGLLQTALLNLVGWTWRWPIVLVVAGGFALLHVGAAHWTALPGLFVLGIALGCLYEWTGSLWPGIVVHLLFNAFNISVVLSGAVS